MPLLFPWEKRKLEEYADKLNNGHKLLFKPFLVYFDYPRNLYVVVLYRWIINGLCPFNRDNQCIIHGDHPLSCKMFPLIVGVYDNTLRVSLACNWVKEHLNELKNMDPAKVFVYEYRYAIETFVYIKSYIDYLESRGLKKVVLREDIHDKKVIDVDEYIDMVEHNEENMEGNNQGDKS